MHAAVSRSNSTKTVSYTHLGDHMFKMVAYFLQYGQNTHALRYAEELVLDSLSTSVSYTHLDVYKRQIVCLRRFVPFLLKHFKLKMMLLLLKVFITGPAWNIISGSKQYHAPAIAI